MLLKKQARLPNASLSSYVARQNIKTSNPIQHGRPHFNAIRTLDICRVAISPTHKISYAASNVLKDTSHVLHAPTRQRYEALLNGTYDERQEGLWIMFTSNPMDSKKVVRSWVKRRVALAILEELKRRGFDQKGRRMANLEGGPVPDVLVGTVDIEVLKKCIEAKHEEVRRQAGLVVQEILRICGALLDGRRREAEDKTFQDATISKWDKRMTKPTVRRHLEQAMAVVSKDFVTLCFKAYMENVYVLRQL